MMPDPTTTAYARNCMTLRVTYMCRCVSAYAYANLCLALHFVNFHVGKMLA